jgi:hypothetical protein
MEAAVGDETSWWTNQFRVADVRWRNRAHACPLPAGCGTESPA